MSDEERKAAANLIEAQRNVIKLSDELIAKLDANVADLVEHLREAQEEIDLQRRRNNALLAEIVELEVSIDLRDRPSRN